MAHVKLAEHFDAPIEEVYELLVDASRWPEWMPNIEFKEATGPLDKAGTKVLSVTRFLGRTFETWDEITEAERPRLWGWGGDSAGMKYRSTFRLTPAGGGGTDFVGEADYEFSSGFLGHIADRLYLEKATERQMRHSMENFKALIESRVPVPA